MGRGGSLERVERAENRVAWVTGVALLLLCVYVVATAALNLLTRTHAESSPIGIGLALVAVVGMPLLAWRKRVIAAPLGSAALRGDAACSITCAYMAGTLLVGLTLNALFGWWWADSLAALGLLYWLVPEAREALEGARAGHGAWRVRRGRLRGLSDLIPLHLTGIWLYAGTPSVAPIFVQSLYLVSQCFAS
jgi:uncharacterized integral membrane protein